LGLTLGSVYFTSDILATTDRLELLCRQSKIRSRGMTQYQKKGHFVRKTPSCSWCNGYICVTAAMPMVLGSTLTLLTCVLFCFFCFFSIFA